MAKLKWVLQAILFSLLRRAFRRSPMYDECLKKAKREVKVKGKTKDNIRRVKYECAECGALCQNTKKKKEFAVDHRETVIPLEGLPIVDGVVDFNVYIKRLFCSADNLQILCKICHDRKSKAENTERKRLKDERNPEKPITKRKRRVK